MYEAPRVESRITAARAALLGGDGIRLLWPAQEAIRIGPIIHRVTRGHAVFGYLLRKSRAPTNQTEMHRDPLCRKDRP